jgi:type VI protein secretion system component VasF
MNGDDEDIPEGLANARLIAAAPDMLSALIDAADALLCAFGQISNPDDPAGWSDADAFESYLTACAAIKKATGAA